MANDFNSFTFIGRLVRDAEMMYTASGAAVSKFSIAVNKKTNNNKDYCNFFEVELWGAYASALEKFLLKGTQVLVSGEVKQDRWQDKGTGSNRSKILFVAKSVQLLGRASQVQNQTQGQPKNNYNNSPSQNSYSQNQQQPNNNNANNPYSDDNIPF